jgi:HAD superfamily hydrolase (TIGR01450 family)
MTQRASLREGRRPGVVLDLDGTIWVDGRLIPGAADCIQWLQRHGYPLVYLTNNPVRPETYAARLTKLGLPTRAGEVISASTILKDYLKETAPQATLYVLADPEVRAQFEPDFRFSDDPAAIDVVIATSPTALDYAGLTIAFRAIRRGARFVATNADPSWVSLDNVEVPHAGAVIGALEASTKKTVELVAGKPSSLAAERVRRCLDRSAAEIVVVGDSLHTDVRFARENGMRSILVWTGVARRDDLGLAEVQPDHALDSIAGLPGLLEPDATE